MSKRLPLILALIIAAAAAAYDFTNTRGRPLTLTGIVTTDGVNVSALVGGQLEKITVKEGDTVERGQIVAVLAPGELQAERAYFEHNRNSLTGQIEESEAALRLQERQTEQQIRQADANLAAEIAQQAESAATQENAKATLARVEMLAKKGSSSDQELDQARTAFAVAKARAEANDRQVEAQRATLALAKANAEQTAMKKSAIDAAKQQQEAAAAQLDKAGVRLGYAEIKSPANGIVDVRAARPGEVVSPGQPIITIIDPDELWVRVDVEETYIDRLRLGDKLTVRLPSGEERAGTVFHRGVDAGFATQRDVSRTKRDIKTFEVRLNVDNRDRRLAVGMTAYVSLPVD